MKGLLLKDIGVGKIILFVLPLFGLYSLLSEVMTFMPIGLAALIPLSVLGNDYVTKWNKLEPMMPVRPSVLVVEKYLVSALCMLFGLVIFILCTVISHEFLHRSVTLGILIPQLIIIITIAILMVDISLPLLFLVKSQTAHLVIIFISAGLVGGLSTTIVSIAKKVGSSSFLLGCLAAVILITAGSIALSMFIYRRKDK